MKALLIDIETAPILGYVWGLWENNVALNQVKSDWHLISFAAKWLNDKRIIYMDQREAKDITNDRPLLSKIRELLDESDVVITQNGKTFDIKKINARLAFHNFKPPSSFKQIDTKVLAKKHFGFTSTKLEYLSDKLCTKYKKLKHTKFQGFELWKECLGGNIKAWKELERYNKYDVLALEELYYKLIAWDNSVNFSVYRDDGKTVCTCGSTSFTKNGFFYSSTGKYQRYSCSRCGSEFRNRKVMVEGYSKPMKVGTAR